MKKLQSGKWGLRIKGGDTSIRSLLIEAGLEPAKIQEQHKVKPSLYRNFHPTKGFGYRSRRGKRSNGTKTSRL